MQVSAGEEGISVGSAAALTPDDVVFAQYRETGVFQQRGFTLKDFMSQLFANCHDNGRGRNMPVHYGSNYPRTVSDPLSVLNRRGQTKLTVLISTQSPPPLRRKSPKHLARHILLSYKRSKTQTRHPASWLATLEKAPPVKETSTPGSTSRRPARAR